ncbi:MAG: carboxypeptidase regulatory-like domain-containing protein, partial [Pirellulales bacterium]|nr:carboxypeptidase regulatory-like domain-containing protein [Pirellulales bacterium]
ADYGEGSPVANAQVYVFDPDGFKIGSAKTDDKGEFAYTATRRCDHRFVVNAGGGHGVEKTLPEARLPQSLPAEHNHDEEPPADHDHTAGDHDHEATVSPVHNHDESDHDAADEQAWRKEVLDQLSRLQIEVHSLERASKVRDILGGIGYILGLAGISFYFLGRRKEKT